MNSSLKPKQKGQALLEYLLVFCFMAFFGVNLVKGITNSFYKSVGFIGYEISQQLTIGVCEKLCFYKGYDN